MEICFVGVRKLTHNLRLVDQNIFIAYSGGIDSHVLLHLCASDAQLKAKLTAVYINHGLQAESESWGKHCEQVCNSLDVKFISLTANAQAAPGESPEEAARNARYAALKPLLGADDVLLLAQHAEDQLETVLLQLFRGSGLKGLSGMPASMTFGQGKLVRPLLEVSKNDIIAYANAHNLKWIEDPSNQHRHFDRNFLRHDIIPLLKQRWPSLAITVSRAAGHCANAQDLLGAIADDGLSAVMNLDDNTLSISRLQGFTLLQQALIIRQWFQHLGLKIPSQALVQQILSEVVAARADADPHLSTQGHCLRRYRDKLYCLKPMQHRLPDKLAWPSSEPSIYLTNDLIYQRVESSSGIPCEQWHKAKITIRFRSGGESIRLPHRSGHHALKKLYQEAGIPPWERAIIPLIYLDNKLAAVGEHWLSAEFYSAANVTCYRIVRCKINPKGNDGISDVD